jgi:hypothetical protein
MVAGGRIFSVHQPSRCHDGHSDNHGQQDISGFPGTQSGGQRSGGPKHPGGKNPRGHQREKDRSGQGFHKALEPAVFRQARKQKISILPGIICSTTGRYRNFLRISCGYPWSEPIEKGIKTLAKIIGTRI